MDGRWGEGLRRGEEKGRGKVRRGRGGERDQKERGTKQDKTVRSGRTT